MDDTYFDILRKCYVAKDLSRGIYLADYLKIIQKNSPFVEKYLFENSRELFLLEFIRLCLKKSTQKCKIVSNILNRLKNVFHEHQDSIFFVLKEEFSKILVPLCKDSNIILEFFFAFNFHFEDILREKNRTTMDFFLQIALASKQNFCQRHPSGESFVDIVLCTVYLSRLKSLFVFQMHLVGLNATMTQLQNRIGFDVHIQQRTLETVGFRNVVKRTILSTDTAYEDLFILPMALDFQNRQVDMAFDS
ncbi:hypothetical protein TNCT_291121 [Trichonephila clavata]|uniref:Uncharacterized protein n=1 Tax=Trichonephila clavata TaxID=2740835 RepID=A0A8X6HB58_TRICU|nr:hypothetical protein TNCT_291121 [Trichonephila clavata]